MWYLLSKNNITNELNTVATFKAPGDAAKCCSAMNRELKKNGTTILTYGVSTNPMIWRIENEC